MSTALANTPAMQVYNEQPVDPSLLGGAGTVHSQAAQHADRLRYAEARYAVPTNPQAPGTKYPLPDDAPSWMNRYPHGNVKYAVNDAEKEYMVNKNTILKAQANLPRSVQRMDVISDREVDYLKRQKEVSEYAKRDAYINMFYDTTRPGVTAELYKNAPDHMQTRLAQIKSEFDFALRKRLVDEWGVNSPEDLEFRYMLDQGYITGPELKWNETPPGDVYRHGLLSPYALIARYMKTEDQMDGVNMPLSNSAYGYQGSTAVLNTPLQGGSDLQLAKSMYDEGASVPRNRVAAVPATR